mmetsp:Transcript_25186/g.70434  ORF Transcript_25186/g.70434 Transcript_25186/m.70434 type:complete len:200 (-) Transcript_25186:1959-2558(-)
MLELRGCLCEPGRKLQHELLIMPRQQARVSLLGRWGARIAGRRPSALAPTVVRSQACGFPFPLALLPCSSASLVPSRPCSTPGEHRMGKGSEPLRHIYKLAMQLTQLVGGAGVVLHGSCPGGILHHVHQELGRLHGAVHSIPRGCHQCAASLLLEASAATEDGTARQRCRVPGQKPADGFLEECSHTRPRCPLVGSLAA